MLLVALLLLAFRTPKAQLTDRSALLIGYSEHARADAAEIQGGAVTISTAHGKIKISLLQKNAPQTASAVLKAASGGCPNCSFYRNEARPEQGSLGPPYGLLQGRLASLDGNFAREGNIVARRGLVCSIPATKEFFVATCDHSEWGTSHTCWGEISDLSIVERIVSAPYKNYTHPDYGTVMRMLAHQVPFQLESSHLALQ